MSRLRGPCGFSGLQTPAAGVDDRCARKGLGPSAVDDCGDGPTEAPVGADQQPQCAPVHLTSPRNATAFGHPQPPARRCGTASLIEWIGAQGGNRRRTRSVATLGQSSASARCVSTGYRWPKQAPVGDLDGRVERMRGTSATPIGLATEGSDPGPQCERGNDDSFIGYLQALVTTECKQTTPSYHFRVAVGTTAFTEVGVSPGDTVVASWFYTSRCPRRSCTTSPADTPGTP